MFEVGTEREFAELYPNWDVYEPNLYQIPADIQVPLLMISGDLDPQTSFPEAGQFVLCLLWHLSSI